MTEGELIVPGEEPQGRAIAVQSADRMVALTSEMIAFAGQQVALRDEFMRTVLREGHDFGVVPGTKGKRTLFKSGAERLLSVYQLRSELSDESPPTLDLTGRDHGGETFLQFRRRCRIYHGDTLITQAAGETNSWETKYRYRDSKRRCPQCGDETGALLRSKNPPRDDPGADPGWFCWAKKGGCGANFAVDDERITSQKIGRVPNPNPADIMNTLLKLADKRALVAATIIATGWSDLVTQDLEDRGPDDAGGAEEDGEAAAPEPAASRSGTSTTIPITAEQAELMR
ncbi:MAG: hypothetical protein ACRDRD_17150, partial [Pseudonocardiaceae bacterium]